MRIGPYRITSISPRFFVFLGLGLFVLFMTVTMLKPEPPPDRLAIPAFYFPYDTPVQTAALDLKALDGQEDLAEQYVEPFEVERPDDFSIFYNAYSTSIERSFRYKVYLPTEDEVSSFEGLDKVEKTRDGWRFVPAIYLQGDRSYGPDVIAELQEEMERVSELTYGVPTGAAEADRPVVLGFPADAVPPRGAAYEVTSMLYWRSDLMFETPPEMQLLPVFLVSNQVEVGLSELAAPTTHYADLDLRYREGERTLLLHRVEISQGQQIRVCLSVRNDSPTPQPQWEGVGDTEQMRVSTASGSTTGDVDPLTPIGDPEAIDELAPNTALTGYLVFDSPTLADVAKITDQLNVTLPSLVPSDERAAGDRGNLLQVAVSAEQLNSVYGKEHSAQARLRGCSQAPPDPFSSVETPTL